MARHVRRVSGPAVFCPGQIDEVTAYLATREQATIEFEIANPGMDGGNEHAADLAGQHHLGIDMNITPALGNRDANEATVAQTYSTHGGDAIER